jgi:hypothetical protein
MLQNIDQLSDGSRIKNLRTPQWFAIVGPYSIGFPAFQTFAVHL